MRSLFLNLEMMLRIDDRAFADAMRRYVEGEVEQSVRITREAHRAKRTWFNRIRWGIAYFLVAIADYSISHRLNFGGEPTPSYSFPAPNRSEGRREGKKLGRTSRNRWSPAT